MREEEEKEPESGEDEAILPEEPQVRAWPDFPDGPLQCIVLPETTSQQRASLASLTQQIRSRSIWTCIF